MRCQEPSSHLALCPVNWCSRLLKMTKTAHCGNCPTNHRFLINFDDTGRLDGFQEATVKLALQLRQMGRSFREYLKGLVL